MCLSKIHSLEHAGWRRARAFGFQDLMRNGSDSEGFFCFALYTLLGVGHELGEQKLVFAHPRCIVTLPLMFKARKWSLAEQHGVRYGTEHPIW